MEAEREETWRDVVRDLWRDARPRRWFEWLFAAMLIFNVVMGVADRNVSTTLGWLTAFVLNVEIHLEQVNGRAWKSTAQDWRRLAEGWHARLVGVRSGG